MNERRTEARYPTRLDASVLAGFQRFEAVCTDLGRGGASFSASDKVQPGTEVLVALRPQRPGEALVSLAATVVYVVHPGGTRRAGFGVRWQDPLDAPGLAGLERLLRDATGLPEPDSDRETRQRPRYDGQGTGDTDRYDVRKAKAAHGSSEPIR